MSLTASVGIYGECLSQFVPPGWIWHETGLFALWNENGIRLLFLQHKLCSRFGMFWQMKTNDIKKTRSERLMEKKYITADMFILCTKKKVNTGRGSKPKCSFDRVKTFLNKCNKYSL